MKIAVEEGDIITFNENNTVNVSRNGSSVIEGLAVSESFFDRCVDEGVIDDEDDADECGKTDEAAILTYEGGKGYVLVKENARISLGNRMRARAFLTNEGYSFDSRMLDKAADGEVVTL